jgi:hypothetical protein
MAKDGLKGGPLPDLGWREWVGLPELGVEAIKVKVDTGARTSSLHAFDLEEFVRDDAEWVRFDIHPRQRRATPSVRVELPIADRRLVRNSGGKAQMRPVVRTEVRLGAHRWPIEITLTRRDAMGFRMLLGREAIRGRFMVDPGRSYRFGRPPRTASSRSKSTTSHDPA